MSRYIDADLIVYDHAVARSLDDGHNWNELVVCKDQIDDIPTADVVEVVHGEWIELPHQNKNLARGLHQFVCNICGSGMFGEPNYCPNCGAKMDGEK